MPLYFIFVKVLLTKVSWRW